MKRVAGILMLAALLLGGCATDVAIDYDQEMAFSQLKSYRLFAPDVPRSGHVQLDSPMIAGRVNRAIERQLGVDGYQQADSNPDFLVTYHLQVKQEVRSRDTGFSWGFGASRYGRYGGVGMTYGMPSYEVYSYEKGILTIDILTPGEKKLIWRGSIGRRLSSSTTPEESEKGINEVVVEILSSFPPGKKK
ncbi:MAG: DUF4136 domain-containing protein [Gammaproteobacteria bacterium]|nr:DUF4136 domain-containing protein [Gammaproteobacteria bacterium]